MKSKKEKIYIISQTIGKCQSCEREDDIRVGHCFDCVEAESIITEGKDMRDNGNVKTSLEKLKMLIEKGWTPPKQK